MGDKLNPKSRPGGVWDTLGLAIGLEAKIVVVVGVSVRVERRNEE